MKKGTMHKAANDRFKLNLRRLREERGLSQPALAVKMKISKAYVSMLETGDRGVTLHILTAAAEVFGVPVGTLLK